MNRASRSFIALAVLGLSAAAAAAQDTAPLLTLNEALERARDGNRKLAMAGLEVGRASDKLGEVKAERLPSLTLDGTAGRTLNTVEFNLGQGKLGSYPGTGPIPAADTRITTDPAWMVFGYAHADQPLSQLYKLGIRVHASEEKVEVAREELRGARQALTLQVRKAYYAIVATESSLAAARESLEMAREIQREVENLARENAVLAHEAIGARAAAEQAAYRVARLESEVATSREQLNVLLGRDPWAEFRVEPLPDPQPLGETETEAIARAVEGQSDTRLAKLRASLAARDVALAKAEYIPDASFTVGVYKPYQVEFQPKTVWAAGILFHWNVFDGGRRAKVVAEKRKAEEEARLAVADADAIARAAARENWRRVRDSERLLGAARTARDAARDRLRSVRARFEEHATLAEDLRRAEADLASADDACNEASISYWSARADYDFSIGEES
jgi:outer membrane protein TolC